MDELRKIREHGERMERKLDIESSLAELRHGTILRHLLRIEAAQTTERKILEMNQTQIDQLTQASADISEQVTGLVADETDREQVLETMIANLEAQIELLTAPHDDPAVAKVITDIQAKVEELKAERARIQAEKDATPPPPPAAPSGAANVGSSSTK